VLQSAEELSQKLLETGYFIDPTMTKVVFLADQMKKPLLLEGPAGSGKSTTLIARSVGESMQCNFQQLSIADLKQQQLADLHGRERLFTMLLQKKRLSFSLEEGSHTLATMSEGTG
jgi:ABC-type uncharacterized transport system YnjBCD ATPase subunit